MKEQIASFGFQIADPTIPWPRRGTGGRVLEDRPCWDRRRIPAQSKSGVGTMGAMCLDQLAVNVMLEGEGFAISTSACGSRLSYGGRVFATCAAAMEAAEAMMAADDAWSQAPTVGLSDRQREALRTTTEAAERAGLILLDRVFPS